MRKIVALFAILAATIAALLYQGNLPGVSYENARAALGAIPSVGGGVAPSPKLSVADPMGDRIIPMHMMTEAKNLPTERYHDYSFVFD
jgi:hypothetical protein